MKKLVALFMVVFLLFSIILPVFAKTQNDKIKKNELSVPSLEVSVKDSYKASPETIEIAKEAVQKLAQAVVFNYGLGFSTEEMYETAKWVAPEVLKLETKKDAALALIELYEDLLEEFCTYDLKSYYTLKGGIGYVANDSQEINNLIKRGRDIFRIQLTIEGMLALGCYYDLLDEQEISRMLNDFNQFAYLKNTASNEAFNENNSGTLFEIYRRYLKKGMLMCSDLGSEKNNKNFENLQEENPEVYFSIGFIDYTLGSSTSTTSGNSVTTFSALSELTNSLKDSFYEMYADDPDYSDAVYISSATAYYSGHSFAWYDTTPSTKWIMQNYSYQGNTLYGVERYISDDHCTYLGTSDSVVQIGDIIVYRKNGNIVHSGIIVGTNPIRVESKWSQGCVWTHNKGTVPSNYMESGVVNVEYYRYTREHELTYTRYNSIKHRATCTVCGYTTLEPHFYMLDPDICDFCGYTCRGGLHISDCEHVQVENHKCTEDFEKEGQSFGDGFYALSKPDYIYDEISVKSYGKTTRNAVRTT